MSVDIDESALQQELSSVEQSIDSPVGNRTSHGCVLLDHQLGTRTL